jgi:hypothetical protein
LICRAADVFAKGAIATANVTMQGSGRVTVAGLQKTLTADLNGISSLFVDGASGAFMFRPMIGGSLHHAVAHAQHTMCSQC